MIRAYGCSNFTAAGGPGSQRGRRDASARAGFATAQNEYSLYNRAAESELVPALARAGHGPAAVLPARLRPAHRQVPARQRRTRGHPAWHCRRRHSGSRTPTGTGSRRCRRSPTSAASRCSSWPSAGSPHQPGVSSVIAGVTSPEQVESNAAAGSWQPTAEDLAALAADQRRRTGAPGTRRTGAPEPLTTPRLRDRGRSRTPRSGRPRWRGCRARAAAGRPRR